MRLLSQVRRQLADVGVPSGLPIQATEINYGLSSGSPLGSVAATPISEKRQVANVMRTYLLGAARRLAKVFWYRYDWGYVSSIGGTLGNTLLTTPGQWDQVTPAGQAVCQGLPRHLRLRGALLPRHQEDHVEPHPARRRGRPRRLLPAATRAHAHDDREPGGLDPGGYLPVVVVRAR